jgi:hypothetical protein
LWVGPGAPGGHDSIAIQARYTSPCPGDGGSVRIQGTEIALLATENCGCDPFAHSENIVTFLAPPLPAGQYEVKLFAAANASQPGCSFDPRLAGSTTLTVGASDLELETEPAEPTAGEPVTLVVRTRCPLLFAGPAVADRVIRVLGHDDPLVTPGPCTPGPTFESRLALGPLAPGTYSVLVLTEGLDEPELAASLTLEVSAGAAEALLLLDGRFRVTATWRTAEGATGPAVAVPLSNQGGAFWFFRPTNLEIFVKLLDGCDLNNRFWVFASGLTNVEVALRVEDLATGTVKTYQNPLGHAFEPVLDTQALACP